MTMQRLRAKFEQYYADLKADARRHGYVVNKAAEWDMWKEKYLSGE